ncbi:MAG: dicarboxylate/amino acid:cation symporter [Lentisphaeria bacterium]|nr:dicarboxylate/amino acid:cation symporter [Lentisphaeria bacterium]
MSKNDQKVGFNWKQSAIWLSALVLGSCLGLLGISWLNDFFDFVATVYTKLFKFIAVPTIALAVMTTLAMFGGKKNIGKIFGQTLKYTLLTTLAASILGAVLFKAVAPGNLPATMALTGQTKVEQTAADNKLDRQTTVYKHILNVIPDNVVKPFSSGNVLSILIIAAACGLGLALMEESENTRMLLKSILGLQELLFTLIKALVWTLPLGIVAFSAQLSLQMSSGWDTIGSLGKYVLVVLGGNLLQFFIILPLFLLANRINPLKVFKNMLPAVMMAFFTKSSTATLPVTVASAENNMKAKPEVARFVLPLCCTINMNGCAAFILVTSLFMLQNGGNPLTLSTICIWILISVVSAIGNAGVPMGCFFLTLSLMSGVDAPLWILGIILPVYAIIDMIETGVNVWSDSCVCAMVDKKVK